MPMSSRPISSMPSSVRAAVRELMWMRGSLILYSIANADRGVHLGDRADALELEPPQLA